LLHLIQKAQIDIYDIPIALVTDQYVQYVSEMAEMDLELASEFVSLAATLLSIKVRMLLPRREPGTPEEASVDPRVELVEALLEYSAYKHAAEALKVYHDDMALRFARELTDDRREPHYDPDEPLKATLYDLISAMKGVLSAATPTPPVEIRLEKYTFRAAFFRILRGLRKKKGKPVLFKDLFDGDQTRASVVVMFLAVLELSRQGRLLVLQDSVFGEISIVETEGRLPIERPAS